LPETGNPKLRDLLSVIFEGVPGCVLPEEIVQVAECVNVEKSIPAEVALDLASVMQANGLHRIDPQSPTR
jgi:hypothetical protein